MDNQELLTQVTDLMKQQTDALNQKMVDFASEITNTVGQMLEENTRDIKLMIENDVTTRIDALFDGYKLTHEKQWELERRTEAMQSKIEHLELRLLALENKSA